MNEQRIAEIGRRANALARDGFYSREEVAWLADYVRGDVLLIEVELMLTNAEKIVERERDRAVSA